MTNMRYQKSRGPPVPDLQLEALRPVEFVLQVRQVRQANLGNARILRVCQPVDCVLASVTLYCDCHDVRFSIVRNVDIFTACLVLSFHCLCHHSQKVVENWLSIDTTARCAPCTKNAQHATDCVLQTTILYILPQHLAHQSLVLLCAHCVTSAQYVQSVHTGTPGRCCCVRPVSNANFLCIAI